MNTNRIKITNIDQSTSLATAETPVRAYTVIAAPKGPATPVYIEPGQTSKIYETFGYTTAEYPEIQDVIDFNRSYGIFVSAPYITSDYNQIPVAYATPAGVFAKKDPVSLKGIDALAFENLEDEDTSIEGLTTFSRDSETILIPVNQAGNLFKSAGDEALSTGDSIYPGSEVVDSEDGLYGVKLVNNDASIKEKGNVLTNTKLLYLSLGFPLKSLLENSESSTSVQFLRNSSASEWEIMTTANSNTSDSNAPTGKLLFKFPDGGTKEFIVKCELKAETSDSSKKYLITAITGDSNNYFYFCGSLDNRKLYLDFSLFDSSYDENWWSITSNRESVKVYWEANLKTDAIYGVLYPKYLSSRPIEITFNRQKLGNLLSFTVTEPDTPTTSVSHSISGSLDENAVDGYGASIGMTSQLVGQEVINCHTIKTFYKTFFTQTQSTTPGAPWTMPPVNLEGGVRIEKQALVLEKPSDNNKYKVNGYLLRDSEGNVYGKDASNEGASISELLGVNKSSENTSKSEDTTSVTAKKALLPGVIRKAPGATTQRVGSSAESQDTKVSAEEFEKLCAKSDNVVQKFLPNTDAGWNYALNHSSEYSELPLFFTPYEVSNEIGSTDGPFFALGSKFNLSNFVFPSSLPSEIKENMAQLSYGSAYSTIVNGAIRTSSFTRENYHSTLIGAYCRMLATIIDRKQGGAAPMWINDSGFGGQLGVSVKRMDRDFSPNELEYLDDANYNPIIKDNTYGVMATSQRTCKGGEESDWSFLGHVMAFLDFERDVKVNVLLPQIGKANNPFYREKRAIQTQSLLDQRLQGSNPIWAEGIVDTSTAINTPEVQSQRGFKVAVRVKVYTFSEWVELVFTNVAQTTSISTSESNF